MKRYFIATCLLSSILLVGCSNTQQESAEVITPSSEVVVETISEPKPKIFGVGDSYTFVAEDFTNSTGLKITVEEVAINKELSLNTDYSSEDYSGLVPVVLTTTFENTTNDYIDIGAFEILDADGNMGKWVPYLEGTSTQMPDGLNAGQKVKMVQVFGSPSEKNFDLTYSGATWRVE